MCGIVGVLGLNGAADPRVVRRMSLALRHRGPDADGVYVEGAVGLGFRRLSILDLTPTGDQPMLSADGRLALVFNGEIYNYVELRRELQGLGHRFRSTGDTEVLLHAYQEWGRDCLHRLNGMWAFLIHDTRTGVIFGSRDRFGVKPLYRCRTRDAVLLASEIKAIRGSGLYHGGPNWEVVSRSLRRRLDLVENTGETFYAGIEQIPAGSAFELRPSGDFAEWRFWSLDDLPQMTVADPPAQFRELFDDAVRLRMRSDVPVAVSLSGGLDSTSIISVMASARAAARWIPSDASLQAFSFMSAEFDEEPEEPYISQTVEQTGAELHRVDVSARQLWDNLERFTWFQDEPVHSLAAMVSYEVYGLAAAHGVKVVLSGSGSDEVIAGYPNYFDDYWRTLLQAARLRRLWQEIDSFARVHRRARAAMLRRTLRHFCGLQLRRARPYRALGSHRRRAALRANPWFTPEVHATDFEPAVSLDGSLDASLRWSVERSPLPLYLRIEDRNSMAHSVEARLPFLDYRLVSMAFQLPPDWKLRGPWNKYVLREAMRGCIPDAVRTRAVKMGFAIPAAHWFRTALYEPMQDLLASERTRSRGLYNVDAIRRDLRKHREGGVNVADALFTIAQLETWLTLDEKGLVGGESLPPAAVADEGVARQSAESELASTMNAPPSDRVAPVQHP
jgi:asparagine synthase (glutamine-hydrolysing)